ncbi:hypothetical protein ES705_12810 [subsurface metagenome]
MPECVFNITGSIADFTRLDNLYSSLRREADKALKEWTIAAEIKYSEKQGEKPPK